MSKSQDTDIDDQKNNIVAELYALRAGLSVISERADDIRSRESDIEAEYSKAKPIQDEIDENNRKIAMEREKEKKISKELELISIDANYKNKVNAKYEKKTGNMSPMRYMFMAFIIGLAVAFGVAIIFFAITMSRRLTMTGIVIFLVLDIGGVLIASIITGIVKIKTFRSYKIQSIDETNAEKEKLETEIKQISENISDMETSNEKLGVQKEEENKAIEQSVLEIKKDMSSITQEVSLYYSAMETEYSNLLNPADWKNADLCIFYLQTGRADSIKECLQLADRQRQNDEIVGALNAASDRICKEISSGFKALGGTMVTCINALSMQIDTVGNSLAAQNKATVRALGALEKSNAALLSSGQLNNALQAKANETSEAMLRDYRYVQNRLGIAI